MDDANDIVGPVHNSFTMLKMNRRFPFRGGCEILAEQAPVHVYNSCEKLVRCGLLPTRLAGTLLRRHQTPAPGAPKPWIDPIIQETEV